MEYGLTIFDWAMIAFYLAFMVLIGSMFRRTSKGGSDFFRGGGQMMWWLTGVSAVVAGFSAMTFTGMAAKVYTDGLLLPAAFMLTIPAQALLWYFAPRFRQMRVVTAVEAVRRRFGPGSERFVTWIAVPINIWYGGFGLVTVATFISAALGVSLTGTTLVIGFTVIFLAVTGGAWSVVASNFIQGLLIFTVVIVLFLLAAFQPEIGGVSHLFQNLPAHHVHWSQGTQRMDVVWFWLAMMMINGSIRRFDLLSEGAPYLFVKDGRQARKMLILVMILWAIETCVAFLPASMSAKFFDVAGLAQMFPQLKQPETGCIVALGYKVLPVGMMGLLVCAIFSAAVTTLNAGMNMAAGIFVRNFWVVRINPNLADNQQLRLGRILTVIFGCLMIGIALIVFSFPKLNLFDLAMIVFSAVTCPLSVAMSMAVVFKHTPRWSCWAATLAGMVTAVVSKYCIDPIWFARMIGQEALNKPERVSVEWCTMTVLMILAVVGTFFFSALFYKRSSEEHKKEVEDLFEDMRTPVIHEEDLMATEEHGAMQYRVLGMLSMVFGGFILFGILIPNSMIGRICYLGVGGTIFGIGAGLYGVYLRSIRKKKQLQ
jgi:solute:Na+ symporter, SSS family